MIYYFIIAFIVCLIVYFIISARVKKEFNKKRKEQERLDEIKYGISDYSQRIKEISLPEMEKEFKKFNLSKRDWLSRKKHILMQKLSRRKNRK